VRSFLILLAWFAVFVVKLIQVGVHMFLRVWFCASPVSTALAMCATSGTSIVLVVTTQTTPLIRELAEWSDTLDDGRMTVRVVVFVAEDVMAASQHLCAATVDMAAVTLECVPLQSASPALERVLLRYKQRALPTIDATIVLGDKRSVGVMIRRLLVPSVRPIATTEFCVCHGKPATTDEDTTLRCMEGATPGKKLRPKETVRGFVLNGVASVVSTDGLGRADHPVTDALPTLHAVGLVPLATLDGGLLIGPVMVISPTCDLLRFESRQLGTPSRLCLNVSHCLS
jgi:hypothetical protein